MMTQEQEKYKITQERDEVKREVQDLKTRRDKIMDVVKDNHFNNRNNNDERSKWIVDEDSINFV